MAYRGDRRTVGPARAGSRGRRIGAADVAGSAVVRTVGVALVAVLAALWQLVILVLLARGVSVGTPQWLRYTEAAGAALVLALIAVATVPVELARLRSAGGRRSDFAEAAGTCLIFLGLLAAPPVGGMIVYELTAGGDGFNVRGAVFVSLAWGARLLMTIGEVLVGVPGRSPLGSVARTVIDLALGLLSVGYANVLAVVVVKVTLWVPLLVADALQGWWGLRWLSVLVGILAFLLWLRLLGAVEVLTQNLCRHLFGEQNAVSNWLDNIIPVHLVRARRTTPISSVYQGEYTRMTSGTRHEYSRGWRLSGSLFTFANVSLSRVRTESRAETVDHYTYRAGLSYGAADVRSQSGGTRLTRQTESSVLIEGFR